jgi:hypothetical protein
MTVTKLFAKYLRQTIKAGFDHQAINNLAGCTDRKVVLTMAEAEAGKLTYQYFMDNKLWNDPEWESAERGWLFGSPEKKWSAVTNSFVCQNIGLIPLKLSTKRLGLNRQNWDSYHQIY